MRMASINIKTNKHNLQRHGYIIYINTQILFLIASWFGHINKLKKINKNVYSLTFLSWVVKDLRNIVSDPDRRCAIRLLRCCFRSSEWYLQEPEHSLLHYQMSPKTKNVYMSYNVRLRIILVWFFWRLYAVNT